MNLNLEEYVNLLAKLDAYIAKNYREEPLLGINPCICAPVCARPLEKSAELHLKLYAARKVDKADAVVEDVLEDAADECACYSEAMDEAVPEDEGLPLVEEYAMQRSFALERRETLEDLLHRKEQTFSEKLFELIIVKKLNDVDVYMASNLDRKLFSKLRKKDYQPSKNTVLALIIGMKLDMAEAKELLSYAGYAFAPSNMTDIIVSYFLEKEDSYDIYLVNDILDQRNCKVLGNSLN